MQNKPTIIILICLFIGVQAFAFEGRNNNVKAKRIDEAMINKLIGNKADNIILKNVGRIRNIRHDKQSFEISKNSKILYVVPFNRDSGNGNSTTCSVLLFDSSGTIKSAFDTAGPDHASRYWACDYVEAMSFRDYYPDGSLKIIVVYYATPPSNERFLLPVILRLNFKKPSLEIDEELTRKLEDADANTIQEVRAFFKKQLKHPSH
jgi:hypothetical protein